MKKILVIAISVATLIAPPALACSFSNETPVKMLSFDTKAWKVIIGAMEQCDNFTAELNPEILAEQRKALNVRPAKYQIGSVTNSSLPLLLKDKSIRPLDVYIAKYGKNLHRHQMIKKDGKIVAIAATFNAQHLMYRRDILKKLNIPVPKTYTEVIAAAQKIKSSRLVDYPLGGAYKTGWDLAQEFINLYYGMGGKLVKKNNQPSINNARAKQTLRIMKSLVSYMDPDYLLSDSAHVQKQLQQGKIAMANLWSSHAAAMDDPKKSKVVGLIGFAAAPATQPGRPPATTLWWDGMVVAKKTAAGQEAETAFRLIMEGVSDDLFSANKNAAIWLTDAFKQPRFAAGALASLKGGAPFYPSSEAVVLMHTTLGNHIAEYLTGKKKAAKILKIVESEYTSVAQSNQLL